MRRRRRRRVVDDLSHHLTDRSPSSSNRLLSLARFRLLHSPFLWFLAAYPPPPPPPAAAALFDERSRSGRNYRPAAAARASHHHQQHGFHRRRHASQDSSFASRADGGGDTASMSNLVGTDHHLHRGLSYNPRIGGAATPTAFRRGETDHESRWRRSRSSPAVAHNFNIGAGGRWQQAVGGSGWQRADIPGEQPNFRESAQPVNFHSSFHDLHAANEMRASRQDLRELRELLRQEDMRSLRSTRTTATNRRSLRERKWPPLNNAMSADEMGAAAAAAGRRPRARHRHDGSPTTLCNRCSVVAETEVANPLFRY